MLDATGTTVITIAALPATGPCVKCGKHACFCELCLKIKRGRRLCGKCHQQDLDLEKPAAAQRALSAGTGGGA
jgi:hypothetical protein